MAAKKAASKNSPRCRLCFLVKVEREAAATTTTTMRSPFHWCRRFWAAMCACAEMARYRSWTNTANHWCVDASICLAMISIICTVVMYYCFSFHANLLCCISGHQVVDSATAVLNLFVRSKKDAIGTKNTNRSTSGWRLDPQHALEAAVNPNNNNHGSSRAGSVSSAALPAALSSGDISSAEADSSSPSYVTDFTILLAAGLELQRVKSYGEHTSNSKVAYMI